MPFVVYQQLVAKAACHREPETNPASAQRRPWLAPLADLILDADVGITDPARWSTARPQSAVCGRITHVTRSSSYTCGPAGADHLDGALKEDDALVITPLPGRVVMPLTTTSAYLPLALNPCKTNHTVPPTRPWQPVHTRPAYNLLFKLSKPGQPK